MPLLLAACAVAAPLDDQLAAARKDGDTFSHVEILQRMLEAKPDDVALRCDAAEMWLSAGDAAAAMRLVGGRSDVPAGLLARASAMQAGADDPGNAIRILSEVRPDDAGVLDDLQRRLAQKGDAAARVEVLKRLVAVRGKDAGLLVALAEARRDAGDYSGAMKDIKAAALLEPGSASVRSSLPAFERLERVMPVIAKTSATLKKSPKDAGALLRRSAAFAAAGVQAQAVADARAALEVMPDSLAGAILLAYNSDDEPELPVSRSFPAPCDEALAALIDCDVAVTEGREGAEVERVILLNRSIGQGNLAVREAAEVSRREPGNLAAARECLFAATAANDRRLAGAAWAKVRTLNPPAEVRAACLEALAAMFFRAADFSNAADFAAESDKAMASDSAKQIWRDAEGRLAR